MKNYFCKLIKATVNSDYRFQVFASRGFYNNMSDEEYLKRLFKATIGYPLDLENPQTFNEKLQWLKLHDRNPEYTSMVDKYAVKKYVAEKIGEEYIIPILGVWDKFDDIDFDSLPNQFVLKCNHDSGGIVICKDKSNLNIKETKRKINRSLGKNFYWFGREYPYKNVPRKIIAEAYMEDEYSDGLRDYKVLCFNGVPKLIEVHMGRYGEHTQDFFDSEWSITHFEKPDSPRSENPMERPAFLEEMLKLSSVLSENIPHVRVDWYFTDNHLYFGELTFYNGSGFKRFLTKEQDLELGKYINLGGGK